ncbi:MAG: cytochrome c biogenesis protein CcsA [Ignavibacterium sp.]
MAGSIIITFALVFSIFAMLMYFFTYRGANNTINFARISFHIMAMLVFVASAYFLYLILTHQYQYKYIYSYSSSDLSLGYLISTFWAGQEGSFMLWLFLTTIVGIILQSYVSKRGDLEPRVMAIFTLATTFLLAMVSPLLKNPFAFIWTEPIFIEAQNIAPAFFSMPLLQSYIFNDPGSQQNFVKVGPDLYAALQSAGFSINDLIIQGRGLNPLLQNFWMQIHPPILFTGFSMATVPFAFAISALMKNDYKDWVRQAFPWVLTAGGILGLGIMLGGYWAYSILGWGGYWAWDPVENSSLVPWLISVASIHTMLVQRKSQAKGDGVGKFAKTNLILSMLIYILVLYSTFLTRSGILGDASVHSFVDPGTVVYLFLIVFIGTFIILGGGLLIYRWKSLSTNTAYEEGILSRELALFTAAITLCTSAVIVLVGTSAPIFGSSVDTSFYNEMHIPLAIIIGLLNGLSLLLKWKQTNGEDILKKSRFSLIATLVFAVLLIGFGKVRDIMMILLGISAGFTFFVNLEIAYKIFRGNKQKIGAYVAHIGIALFILGVISSAAYDDQKDIDLVKGKPIQIYGYTVEFTGYHPIENNTKFAFNVKVKNGSKNYNVSPIMYISDFNKSLMREPDILVGFTKDLYIAPLGYDDGSNQSSNGTLVTLTLNEQTEVNGSKIKYAEFIKPDMSAMTSGSDFQMGAKLIIENNGVTYNEQVLMKKEGNNVNFVPIEVNDANLKIELKQINPMDKKAELIVSKLVDNNPTQSQPTEILSVTASIKPFVSLVWIGVLVMVIGFFVSTSRRLKETLSK